MSLTPFFWQSSNSLFFMRRDALVASGCVTPTPAQNSFMPPPVPVEFDDRGLDAGGLAELLGDGGGERIDGGRSDDADLVARLRGRGIGQGHADGSARHQGGSSQ